MADGKPLTATEVLARREGFRRVPKPNLYDNIRNFIPSEPPRWPRPGYYHSRWHRLRVLVHWVLTTRTRRREWKAARDG